ncbi:MAG: response regulator, partial [Elusimicrobia bacterium]|nr:response regulator [Elusimicrobiota bacterium]
LLAAARYDVVLTDIRMEARDDGLSLGAEVKSRSPGTDVILMTGHPSLDTAVGAMKSGGSDYVMKPFEPAQLQAVIRRCLDRRRLAAELDRERGLRQELESAYSELQKLERLKDGFLARLSHELRTPVTHALLAADVLETRLGDAPAREAWLKLRSAVEALGAVVDELLDFTRASEPGAASPVPLWDLVEGAASALRPMWEARRLRVTLAKEGEPAAVPGDPALLALAVRHLLGNAIRFNKEGGEVKVTGRFGPEEVQLAFADTGLGVPAEALPRLFDGFYQAAEHLTRSAGGLGLGLATVRRVAEAHGGRVSVESEFGRGSVFTLTLPVRA